MDEQFEQMSRFLAALEAFNRSLDSSTTELVRKHDAVNPLWQDGFRKEYDARFQEFLENMKRYCHFEAPRYEDFLREKRVDIGRYLNG